MNLRKINEKRGRQAKVERLSSASETGLRNAVSTLISTDGKCIHFTTPLPVGTMAGSLWKGARDEMNRRFNICERAHLVCEGCGKNLSMLQSIFPNV